VIDRKVKGIAEEMNIQDKLNAYPSTLSGGEKQRVAISRAMIVKPELLLLDEPTSALDPKTKLKILETVNSLNKKHDMTTIIVTHDMDAVKILSDRIAYLKMGKLVFFGEPQHFFSELSHEISMAFDNSEEFVKFSTRKKSDAIRVKVFFWGEKTDEPVLFTMGQKYAVQINIISGNIENLKHGKYGHLECEAKGASVDEFVDELKREVFKVEVMNHV
jgi:D-methionine transport system ATP-binding protein